MALSGTVLGNLIASNIEAIPNFPTTGLSVTFLDQRVVNAIAAAIVSHIQSAAVVNPGTFANPAGQIGTVTSGPGSGGATVTSAPEAITGTGTIS
jgi:hypothetical protein